MNFIDRHIFELKSVRLPAQLKSIVYENDINQCDCIPWLVCHSDNLQNTWEYDHSSAWQKLYDGTDTVEFKLYNEKNQLATYQPEPLPFIVDINSRYCTVHWNDVFESDGDGCYRLELVVTIAGVVTTFDWAKYRLEKFDTFTHHRSTRIRSVINGYRYNENLVFRSTQISDCVRVENSIFGNYQPNSAVENLVLGGGKVVQVNAKSTPSYSLNCDKTSPMDLIKYIAEIHLISANECYISNFNSNSPETYLDVPVVFTGECKIDYAEGLKNVGFEAKFEDRNL